MKEDILKYFYKDIDGRTEFFKPYVVRVIRNRIIDPNTQNFLADGFQWVDVDTGLTTTVPCDDSNWCEYMTFKEGFNQNVLTFPFSLKLHNNCFKTLHNFEEFNQILKKVIDFRVNTIKKGWAIKYGLRYDGKEYPELESLSEAELISWRDPRVHARYSFDDIKEEELIG